MEQNYLSEEELEQLIADVEEEPLHRAPEYLKPAILKKVRERSRKAGSSSKEIQLLSYSAKIIAGAAAAMIMVMTMPVMNKEEVIGYQERFMQRHMERLCEIEERSSRAERPEYANGGNAGLYKSVLERMEGLLEWNKNSDKEDESDD